MPGAGALPAERALRLHVRPQVRRPGGPVEQADPGLRGQGQGRVGPQAGGDDGLRGGQSGQPNLGQQQRELGRQQRSFGQFRGALTDAQLYFQPTGRVGWLWTF